MKTLKEISSENFNETINRFAENTRQITIAEVCEDKNALLKLKFQRQGIEQELEYHRIKMNEE